jgi:HEAT repeat protein
LKSPDSMVGWTAANVLKRTKVSLRALTFVKALTKSLHPVVRWRAVHVLGSFPSSGNVGTVSRILVTDRDHWVRYGAVRSLVEMAALGTSEIRKSALSAIKRRLGIIRRDDRTLNELQSVLFIFTGQPQVRVDSNGS